MCRVAGVTSITDQNRDDVWLFMMVLGEYMSKWNNDGLGYAAFGKDGSLFGERWLVNRTAFSDFSMIEGLTPPMIEKMYSFFGKPKRREVTGLILHARAATCDKNIQNTHPFVNDLENPQSAIIHNGVIANDDAFVKKYSTCDSEVIVHLYDQLKVSENLEHVKQIFKELLGWYTVLGLAKDPSGRMVMDIFTDAPRLHSYFIKELNTRVYSTNPMDITETAREFGMSATGFQQMKANSAIRVDILTGEVIEYVKCTGKYEYNGGGKIVYAEGNADEPDFFKKFRRE